MLTDREEYQFVTDRGFCPLLDYKRFTMDIRLRVEIQRELFGYCVFGRGNIPQANERFFRWIWEHKPHQCEETLRPLSSYSAVYCSHILTRGSHPEMAHDPAISISFVLKCTTVGKMATVKICAFIPEMLRL